MIPVAEHRFEAGVEVVGIEEHHAGAGVGGDVGDADLLDEAVDAGTIVFDGKGVLDDVAIAITEKREVF